MSHARSTGRRVELTVTLAPAAFIAAINASQPGRKSFASPLVAPPSGNRATHCTPLNSFGAEGMIKSPFAKKGEDNVGSTLRLYHAGRRAKSSARATLRRLRAAQ